MSADLERYVYVGEDVVVWLVRAGVDVDERLSDHAPKWAALVYGTLVGRDLVRAVDVCAAHPEHRAPIAVIALSGSLSVARPAVAAYLDSVGAPP